MRTRFSILFVFVLVLTVVPLAAVAATTGYWPIGTDTTLTEDHYGQIEITADNVTLDCAGHTVTGDGTGFGIDVEFRTGVTVRNCRVTGFQHGIVFVGSSGATITGNRAYDNPSGEYDGSRSHGHNGGGFGCGQPAPRGGAKGGRSWFG